MNRPIPAFLAKRGITRIEDNLPPDAEVSFSKLFCQVFREDIQARILNVKKDPACAAADPAGSLPCRSE